MVYGSDVYHMSRDVTQVYLMVSDLEESAAFYADALGLPIKESSDRRVSFDTGTCELKLEADFDRETLAAFGMDSPGERRGDGAIIVITVESVDDVYQSALDADANLLIEPRETSWGRKIVLIRDPDGYVIEISREID